MIIFKITNTQGIMEAKKSFFLICLLAVGGFFFACSPLEDPDTSGPVSASLVFQVFSPSNTPIQGATITLGNLSTQTNAQGLALISSSQMPGGAQPFRITKADYLYHDGVLFVTDGQQSETVVLQDALLNGSFSSTQGGTVSVLNGGSVSFSQNSFVQTNGNSYQGTVNVAATYIAPDDPQAAQRMPNRFLGESLDGNRVFVENRGALRVDLWGANGEPLQLAPGKTAEITMPVSTAAPDQLPSITPLYTYEASSGLWKEEGQAQLQNNAWVAQVSHFSFWMCPYVYPHVSVSGRLVCNGTALPSTVVEVYNPWGAYLGKTTTNANGFFSGMFPAPLTFTLRIKNPCNQTVAQPQVGPFSGTTQLGDIAVCSGNVNHTQISGNFVDCNNQPSAGAWMWVEAQGSSRLVPANAQGQVNASVLLCQGVNSLDIRGVDLVSGASSTPQSFPVSPTISFGTQTICAAPAQFCQFTLDGTPRYMVPTSQYTFSCVYNTSVNRLTPAVVFNGGSGNLTHFSLAIPGATAGNYSIGGNSFHYTFMVLGNDGQDFLQVTLTQAGNTLGAVVEGSVANTNFHDAGGVLHTLSNCQFRFEVSHVI
jgi:hypothetical protein